MKPICGIALVVGMLIQPTTSKADMFVSGLGAVTCAKIADEYRRDPKVEYMMVSWAQGFIRNHRNEYRDLAAKSVETEERYSKSAGAINVRDSCLYSVDPQFSLCDKNGTFSKSR